MVVRLGLYGFSDGPSSSQDAVLQCAWRFRTRVWAESATAAGVAKAYDKSRISSLVQDEVSGIRLVQNSSEAAE